MSGELTFKLGAGMPLNLFAFASRTRTEKVLAVSLAPDDQRTLETMFHQLPWRLTKAATLAQGLRQAMSGNVPVVLCERDLPGGTWRRLFVETRDLAHPPRLIVVSRLADERLWAEVLNLGGHDVLATPFAADEVRRVLSYAVDSWRWQVKNEAKCG